MSKIKVLVIGDDCCSHTGFGKVLHNLFGRMHRDHSDKVDIKQIALYNLGKNMERSIPTILGDDKHGIPTLAKIVKQDGWPDIIFLLNDWWVYKNTLLNDNWKQMNGCLSKIWYYAPFDGLQLGDNAGIAYKTADKVISMSLFGRDEIKKYCGIDTFYLPHGYDASKLHHFDRNAKSEIVFGVVSRNGIRKNLWSIINAYWLAYPKLVERGRNPRLLLHTSKDDIHAGNLVAWIEKAGANKPKVEWTDDVNMVEHEGSVNVRGLSEEDMQGLYERIDWLVSAGREGFGLPMLEARATGCGLIMPRYSAHASMDYPDTIYIEKFYTKPDVGLSDVMDIQCDPVFIAQAMIEASFAKKPSEYKPEHLNWSYLSEMLFNEIIIDGESSKRLAWDDFLYAKDALEQDDIGTKNRCAIVMPGDIGDVILCTATAHALKERHGEVHFITKKENMHLLNWCPWIDDVIQFNEYLHPRYDIMKKAYDYYYTPYFATQVNSNWAHGIYSLSLAETYARECNVDPNDLQHYWVKCDATDKISERDYYTLHVGSGEGRHLNRKYDHWEKVIMHLKKPVYQIGAKSDFKVKGAIDLRGMLSITESSWVISKAIKHIGIDSSPMHIAAILGTKCVALFGNTHPMATGPSKKLLSMTEFVAMIPDTSKTRCQSPCHSLECTERERCINTIHHMEVVKCILQD